MNLLGAVFLALGLFLFTSAPCPAIDSVDITLPASISFNVTDITKATTGLPSPCIVSYSNYNGGANLRITIQALQDYFTRPTEAGGSIYVNYIGWTAGSPSQGGATYSGQLLDTDNAYVYEGSAVSNSFPLTWTLDPLDPSVCAGMHVLIAKWTIESL